MTPGSGRPGVPASLCLPLESGALIAGMDPEDLAAAIGGVGPGDDVTAADVLRVGAEKGRHATERIAEGLVDRLVRTHPEDLGLLWDELAPILEAQPLLVLRMPGVVARVRLNHPPYTLEQMRIALGDRA